MLYASAARGPSPQWDDSEGVLLESRDERTLEVIDSPRPEEVVLAWTVLDGAAIAGTNDGTLLVRREEEWAVVGGLPIDG